MQNGDKGDGLLVAEEKGCGGRSDVGQEVAINGDVTEMGNKTGGGIELQRKENGIAGSRTKRGLESSLNPPPKKRAVSAVRKFPPGYGRTAVTTEVSDVLKGSPVPTFPPGCGRSPVNTTGSGDEGLPSEATLVNNGDALVASPVLGESTSPTLALEGSSNKLESKRTVDDGQR
jgi:euchromatic histone-lysine N-methyltransferase